MSPSSLSPAAAAALGELEIGLVFTAHPTEVLRRTTSEKLGGAQADARVSDAIRTSINGIAAGLRVTG